MGQETLGLGKIIGGPQERDAIHIAVLPVVASERLRPGDWISLTDEGEAFGTDDGIGIVDPFLKGGVRRGQRFWMYLVPGSITSLRHVWAHPLIERVNIAAPVRAATVEESEVWLRAFIENADCPGYDVVMAAAVGEHEKNKGEDEDYTYSTNDGEYLHFGGRDAHGTIPREFWDHVENVTGKKIPDAERARFFGCSC